MFFIFLGNGGHIELLERAFNQFRFEKLNVPEELKSRGVDDPNMVR